MADGTFAILMFVAGLADMGFNHCGSGGECLGRSETTPRLAFSAGQVLERRAREAGEIYLRYDLGHKNGPFGHAVGLSLGEHGETWFGVGQTYDASVLERSPFFAELHAMTGVYLDNGGFDLGGPIIFRSGAEVGWENRRGWRFGLSYDHRSHAGIFGGHNPGIETVQFRVSIPTK